MRSRPLWRLGVLLAGLLGLLGVWLATSEPRRGDPARRRPPERSEDERPDVALATPRGPARPDGDPGSWGGAETSPAASSRVPLPGEERAELNLRLVDRLGEGMASEVQLWQVEMVEDSRWTAGDRLHGTFDVPVGGLTVTDLPYGRYRAFVRGRVRDGSDPPAFVLDEPRERVRLAVDRPRLARFRLDLRNLEGERIERARVSSVWRFILEAEAPFAQPRQLKANPTEPIPRAGGGGSMSGNARQQGERGFDLGIHRESDGGPGKHRSATLLPAGYAAVRADLAGWVEAESREGPIEDILLVATAVPRGWFDEVVLLPSGEYAAEQGARIRVTSRSLEVPSGDSADRLWVRAPIQVEVSLDGYEPLEFETTAELGRPATRILVPAPEDP